jgi:3-hydroxyacyl-CoA dehydrogenase/3a,7a,12a-trihydroxy-5b-cholest-24-enoyl-CoA hydratase
MKLFMDKKLRISGDIMASQKLDFLKKIDRAAAAKVIASKKSLLPMPDAPKAATAPAGPAQAPAIFGALGKLLSLQPNLADELGAALAFAIGDQRWVVGGAAGKGSVSLGAATEVAATFTLADEHLVALVSGARSAQDLYQHGELRVDGDVRFAHKLGIFKGLL